jgi:hypothetical protein
MGTTAASTKIVPMARALEQYFPKPQGVIDDGLGVIRARVSFFVSVSL